MNSRFEEKDIKLFNAVALLQQGKMDKYNEVYELSYKYIYKLINDIVKDSHTTEDLMQETYIKVYEKIDTLMDVRAFYVWAGRIATNLAFRYIQKYRHEVLATADEEGSTDFVFENANDDMEEFIPESIVMDSEKRRMIGDILDNLSVDQKLAVQYFYFEEMSVNEIANEMSCSTGTVKSRLNYARKSIKDAVLKIEKTQGTKLYSISAFPLMYVVFKQLASGGAVAGEAISGIGSVAFNIANGNVTVSGVAAGTAANTAADFATSATTGTAVGTGAEQTLAYAKDIPEVVTSSGVPYGPTGTPSVEVPQSVFTAPTPAPSGYVPNAMAKTAAKVATKTAAKSAVKVALIQKIVIVSIIAVIGTVATVAIVNGNKKKVDNSASSDAMLTALVNNPDNTALLTDDNQDDTVINSGDDNSSEEVMVLEARDYCTEDYGLEPADIEQKLGVSDVSKEYVADVAFSINRSDSSYQLSGIMMAGGDFGDLDMFEDDMEDPEYALLYFEGGDDAGRDMDEAYQDMMDEINGENARVKHVGDDVALETCTEVYSFVTSAIEDLDYNTNSQSYNDYFPEHRKGFMTGMREDESDYIVYYYVEIDYSRDYEFDILLDDSEMSANPELIMNNFNFYGYGKMYRVTIPKYR